MNRTIKRLLFTRTGALFAVFYFAGVFALFLSA